MSKKIVSVGLGGVLVLGMSFSWGQTVPSAKERTITIGQDSYLLRSRLTSLLNANFTFGFHHNEGRVTVTNVLQSLSAREGWSLTTITDHTQITLNELNKHEVVVFNNVSGFNNGTFSNASEQAVQTYIENGGSTLLEHGSGDGEGNSWAWYTSTLHPVGYAGHGNRTNAETFRGADADNHPVMEGLFEGNFEITYGEWYKNNTSIYDNPNAEVLMEFDPTTCGGCIEQQYIHPGGNGIVWILYLGQGMSMYFPFGHDDLEMDGFNDPGKTDNWEKFWNQAVYYLAGYDTLKIGCMDPNASNYDPDADIDSDPSSCVTVGIDIDGYKIRVDNMTFHQFQPAVVFNKPGSYLVQLTDTRGKVIDSKQINGISEYSYDTKSLGSGIYILQASSAGGATHSQRYYLE